MNAIRISAAVLAFAVPFAASLGQEKAPESGAAPSSAQQPAAKPASPDAAKADGAAAPAPPSDAPAPPRGVVRDDEFIPTQELQPDEEVVFPVDI